MLKLKYKKQFKKDYKLSKKRGYSLDDFKILQILIDNLQKEIPLDEQFLDHPLSGNYKNHRECHVKNDWLLIYKISKGDLNLERLGTHSDLFTTG